jgi:hypothetical protein
MQAWGEIEIFTFSAQFNLMGWREIFILSLNIVTERNDSKQSLMTISHLLIV